MDHLFELTKKRVLALAVLFVVLVCFVSIGIHAEETTAMDAGSGYVVTAKAESDADYSSAKKLADTLKSGTAVTDATVLAVVDLALSATPANKGGDGYYEVRLSGVSKIESTDNVNTIRVMHLENGTWVPVTVTAVDAANKTVTFKTSGMSPFSVMRLKMDKTSPVDAQLFGAYEASSKKLVTDKIKTATDAMLGAATNKLNADKLKPSGVADVKISVVSGDAKDNIMDNGIKPIVKKSVENRAKNLNGGSAGDQIDCADIVGIYYFNLTASATGDVTFKMEDEVDATDGYAFVLHYTGISSDEDGITAQFVKVNGSGKVTAHFNSFSPVAIIATTCNSAQKLANSCSFNMGSDDPASTALSSSATTVVGTTTGSTSVGTATTVPGATTTIPGLTSATGTSATGTTTTTVPGTNTTTTIGTATTIPGTATAVPEGVTPEPSPAPTFYYYDAYTGSSGSIVDALKAVGEVWTTKDHRAQIAAANGITGYRGSTSQNLQMLHLLKAGQLKKAQ